MKTGNAKTLSDAKQSLLELLRSESPDTVDVEVVYWNEWDPAVGVRVAEISFTQGNGGGWIPQADMDIGVVCYWAERFILGVMIGEGEDAEWGLRIQNFLWTGRIG